MSPEQLDEQWRQILVKAWRDEKFKKRLLAEPVSVMKEHGLEIPPGCQVKIVEDTDKVFHVTLPAKPSAEELSEEELGYVAGGHAGDRRDRRGCGKPLGPIVCAPTPDNQPPPPSGPSTRATSNCAMCQT